MQNNQGDTVPSGQMYGEGLIQLELTNNYSRVSGAIESNPIECSPVNISSGYSTSKNSRPARTHSTKNARPSYYFRDGFLIEKGTGRAVAKINGYAAIEDYQENLRDLSPTGMNRIGY
jgi:hypothetical protein